MAPTLLSTKRVNLEIFFWDVTILLITAARALLRAIPVPGGLSVNRRVFAAILTWTLWVLAGLTSGWLLGIASG